MRRVVGFQFVVGLLLLGAVAPAREVRPADSGPGSKWTPGLPVDIVDPWATAPAAPVVTAALAGRQSWARPLVDLVDPWPRERDSSVPAPVPARQGIY